MGEEERGRGDVFLLHTRARGKTHYRFVNGCFIQTVHGVRHPPVRIYIFYPQLNYVFTSYMCVVCCIAMCCIASTSCVSVRASRG